jgi:hypothetical protein
MSSGASLPSATTVYIAINAMVLMWNLFLAGRIVNHRRGSPFFLALTALGALLTVPAVVVAATATSILNGRAVYSIEWVWPLVLAIYALQALTALAKGWISPFLGVPIALYDLFLCAAAGTRFASTIVADLPAPIAALGAAHAGVVAFAVGRAALASPLLLQIPVLAPSYPAPYGAGKTMRVALAAWASLTLFLFVAEYPRTVHAAASFSDFSTDRLQERPRGDFRIGLRILPVLGGAPRSLAVRDDLRVVDSLDAGAIQVVIQPPGGVTALALDSLARVLEHERRDSTVLVVALGFRRDDGERFRRDPEAFRRSRLQAVDRILRRLRPDVVFPALDPLTAGRRALGAVPLEWWQQYLREARSLADRVRPATRVGVAASSFTAADSALFHWAAGEGSAVDVLGVSIYPSYGGGSSLVARFHLAERWMRLAHKPAWVFTSGAYPRLYGERNQERALWGVLAWSTAQPRVVGVIVDGAGDYDALTGLRAPGGRLRPALGMLVRATRTLSESVRGM